MNEEEFEKFQKLDLVYNDALSVCDPLNFANRQKDLLWALCRHVLDPYFLEVEQREADND